VIKLAVHPVTKQQIEKFVSSPAQVVMISGATGSGKLAVAKQLAELTLELPPHGIDSYEYALVIRPEDGKSIGIESARQLERFMRLKVPSDKVYNRAVVIEDSHFMTIEAQNALLKTFEEPPAGTIIILTVSYEPALLPTVRSRAQSIKVQRPDELTLRKFFMTDGVSEDVFTRVATLAGGLPGLMSALLADDDHPLRQATEQARQLLSQPLFERLIIVEALSKDKVLAIDTVSVMQRMARLSLQKAAGKSAKRWKRVLEASYQAAEVLALNAQPKLALTNLALQF
jgi:hypothetical protein